MRKKVFFVVSCLRAGGSERVYWLLSQHFDKSLYEVSLIVLDMQDSFFSSDLEEVKVVDLKSVKSSRSFLKLYKLIKLEKPYAIFTTGNHISIILSLLSIFVKIPVLIGREASVIDIMVKYRGLKSKILDLLVESIYKRINIGVCQSKEVKLSLQKKYNIPASKLIVIPNPVLPSELPAFNKKQGKSIVYVGRLSVEKGVSRLLDIFKNLPEDYCLTIVGDGPLKQQLTTKVQVLGLTNRVKLTGQVSNVTAIITQHDLMVLTSFTEGFPNAVVEALSVGVPVVSFSVGGISTIIKEGFNGFIIPQNDLTAFCEHVIKACNTKWEPAAIRADVNARFGIRKIVTQYENLISQPISTNANESLKIVYKTPVFDSSFS